MADGEDTNDVVKDKFAQWFDNENSDEIAEIGGKKNTQ